MASEHPQLCPGVPAPGPPSLQSSALPPSAASGGRPAELSPWGGRCPVVVGDVGGWLGGGGEVSQGLAWPLPQPV